jgi:hypothetical protein
LPIHLGRLCGQQYSRASRRVAEPRLLSRRWKARRRIGSGSRSYGQRVGTSKGERQEGMVPHRVETLGGGIPIPRGSKPSKPKLCVAFGRRGGQRQGRIEPGDGHRISGRSKTLKAEAQERSGVDCPGRRRKRPVGRPAESVETLGAGSGGRWHPHHQGFRC